MKATLSWLNEYVSITKSAAELAEALTMAGLEVEACEKIERKFTRILVARVERCEPHPQSDHLSVCQVNTGTEMVQVVCGAANVRAGLLAPLALPGSQLADGLVIEERDLRGIASYGMLCSEAELGLTERAEGLMVLPDHLKLGSDLLDFVGREDYLFDVFITPNRPDCLSVIGLAREISAITGAPLKTAKVKLPKPGKKKSPMKVRIADTDQCLRYSGRLLDNIDLKPSPYWMAARLFNAGMRPINNIVDVTNYVMLETGQPLHAFDFRMLEGRQIIVRRAAEGEGFTTLDGQQHTLDSDMCLICDGAKAVALAGVMGGLNSEVRDDTTTVFLESAYFEPTQVRRTSKKTGLTTESSRRFERGADPNGTMKALNRASELFVELAGATLWGEENDVYPHRQQPAKVAVSVKKINARLGTTLSRKKIISILSPLEIQFGKAEGDRLDLRVPTFRPDLVREIDIIEEVGRLYGYDNIPQATRAYVDQEQTANEKVSFVDRLRWMLSGMGLKETVSLSLVTPQTAQMFLAADTSVVELLNPLSQELSAFRPHMLISALTATAYNRNRQMPNLRFFEIGHVAWKKGEDYFQKKQVVAILAGQRQEPSWHGPAQNFDFYDIKGLAYAFLAKLGLHNLSHATGHEPFWDSESTQIMMGEQVIGSFGRLRAEVCDHFKIKSTDVFAFYFDVDTLYACRQQEKRFDPIPRFPSVPFDLAILVDVDTPVEAVEKAIRASAGPYLRSCGLFDFYQGEQVPPGRKSLAFSLTFSSKERTLSDEEVEEGVKGILQHLATSLHAELRPR